MMILAIFLFVCLITSPDVACKAIRAAQIAYYHNDYVCGRN